MRQYYSYKAIVGLMLPILSEWMMPYWQTEEEHQNVKNVDSSVCNAYTSLRNGNMWYETNLLKIHPKEMAAFETIHSQTIIRLAPKSKHAKNYHF